MAKNIISEGAVVTRTAPNGGVVSGSPYIIGAEFLVALKTGAAGDAVAFCKQGVVDLPAASEQTFTGDVYFDSVSGDCYDAFAEGYELIGTCDPDNPQPTATTVRVVLNGVSLSVSDEGSSVADLIADLADAETEGKGASTIGIQDAATQFTATTVEGALAEVKAVADAAAQAIADLADDETEGKGSAMIAYTDGETVKDCLDWLFDGTTEEDGAGMVALGAAIPDLTATTTVRAALIELVTRVKALEDA